MAERTMEELLCAPTEGYEEDIVLPEINADHFEIKTNLLQLVQANPFHDLENENPHAHINSFKRITSTLRFRNVPNDVIKLMMFPYSLERAAKTWYEKEPPNSILTWEDLVTKFVAFCLLEDVTAFCLKISLHFASRPHCVLLQDIHCVLLEDLTAFCLKTSLRFASIPHCVLLQVIIAFCFNITAFCSRPPLRFASSYHCVLLKYHCVLLKTSIAFYLKTILHFDRK
ncbi:hypothetical protein Tco_1451945 [Tanacetum coccineum]